MIKLLKKATETMTEPASLYSHLFTYGVWLNYAAGDVRANFRLEYHVDRLPDGYELPGFQQLGPDEEDWADLAVMEEMPSVSTGHHTLVSIYRIIPGC
jgi:hypothetical protein